MRGARVIGTTSTAGKAALARGAGADEVILYTEKDFEAEVGRLTGGRGVDVVYDSVGASTFLKSLGCLRPRGMMVTFGNASGPVPAIEPLLLIPFVENAFKHGVSETRGHPFVNIHLSIKQRQLLFVVKNSAEAFPGQTDLPAGSGIKENIGLSNLRRQLELLQTQADQPVGK